MSGEADDMRRASKNLNALIYLLAVVMLFVGYLVVSGALQRNYNAVITEQLSDRLDVTTASVDSWMASRIREAEAQSETPILHHASAILPVQSTLPEKLRTHPFQKVFRSHFDPYLTSQHILNYALLDTDGLVLASAATDSIGFVHALFDLDVWDVAIGGQATISALVLDERKSEKDSSLDTRLSAFAIAPLIDTSGTVKSVFVMRLNVQNELFNITNYKSDKGGIHTYGFVETGQVISDLSHRPELNENTYPERFIASQISANNTLVETAYLTQPVYAALTGTAANSIVTYESATNKKNFGMWRWVPSMELGIVAEIDSISANRMARYFETLTIMAFSIGLIVVTLIYLIMLDTSQRAIAQHTKLQAVLNSTQDVLFQVEENGTIANANAAIERVFGRTASSVVGLDISALLALEKKSKKQINQSTLRTLSYTPLDEMLRARGRHKDGHFFPIGMRVDLLKQAKGAKEQLLVSVHDYSEFERREAELRDALSAAESGTKTKTSFLSTISHELRSPLLSVIAAMELLGERAHSSEDRVLLESSQRSSQMLLGIIDDILDYSRMETGSLELTENDISIENVLQDVMEILRWSAWNAGVQLHPYCAPGMPMVRADGLRMRQVLLNLVSNAIKFSSQMPHPGEVKVSITYRYSKSGNLNLTMTVSDNGIGMSQETMDQMFEPFTQADGSIRRKYGGTGLGLSITDRLIRKMDGHITVSSTVGGGTLFCAELPMPLAERRPNHSAITGLKGKSICYLGQDPEVRRYVKTYVEFAGGSFTEIQGFPKSAQDSLLFDAAVVYGPDRDATRRLADKLPHIPVLEIAKFQGVVANGIGDPHAMDLTILNAGNLVNRLQILLSEDKNSTPTVSSHIPQSKVLLVEDDQMTREITLRMLTQLGIAADAVVNGEEGLKLWRTRQYAMLLSDCHMPIMDGFQMSAKIRLEEAENALPKTPIIAVSADLTMEIERLCQDCEIDEYVPKPLTPNKLKSLLVTYLSNGKEHHDA